MQLAKQLWGEEKCGKDVIQKVFDFVAVAFFFRIV
jgi:hypothetical protein